jgi:ApaG protein
MNSLDRSLFRSFLRFSRGLHKKPHQSIYLQHRLNPNAEVSWLYFDQNQNNIAILKNLFTWPRLIEASVVDGLVDEIDNKSFFDKRFRPRWLDGERLESLVKDAYRQQTIIKSTDDTTTKSSTQEKYELTDFAMEALRELQLLSKLTEQTSVVRDAGLVITCTSIYSEDDSQLQFSHYTHYYRILIENVGDEPVQLLNRSWIFAGEGHPPVVLPRWAPGVVGEQPVLNSGEGFHYMSSTRIASENGSMEGVFQFSNSKGELFEVPVGKCNLTNTNLL